MNKDKMKSGATGLWTQTKRATARTKQRALELVGKADKIVDVQFDQEKAKFQEHYKAVEKMNKDAEKVMKLMKELSVAQAVLAEDFYLMYENSAPLYNAALKNQDISHLLDNNRQAYEEQMKSDILDPISKYLGQFKEVKDRLAEQDLRRVDVERYARDVKIYQEKNNTAKLGPAQQKLEVAKDNYENLTEELMKDMPALYIDRIPFFDPALTTYLTINAEYHSQSASVTAGGLPLVSHISRGAIHEHERVITPNEESSMYHKVTGTTTATSTPTTVVSPSFETAPAQKTPTRSLPTPGAKPTPVPPAKKQTKARALYDFGAQDPGELGFKVGDVVIVHSQNGEWWEAEMNGKRGLIPSNYVQITE